MLRGSVRERGLHRAASSGRAQPPSPCSPGVPPAGPATWVSPGGLIPSRAPFSPPPPPPSPSLAYLLRAQVVPPSSRLVGLGVGGTAAFVSRALHPADGPEEEVQDCRTAPARSLVAPWVSVGQTTGRLFFVFPLLLFHLQRGSSWEFSVLLCLPLTHVAQSKRQPQFFSLLKSPVTFEIIHRCSI